MPSELATSAHEHDHFPRIRKAAEVPGRARYAAPTNWSAYSAIRLVGLSTTAFQRIMIRVSQPWLDSTDRFLPVKLGA